MVVYTKAGVAVEGKDALDPEVDAGAGTIYAPTGLTLRLRHERPWMRGHMWF